MGRFEEAIKILEEAIKIDPENEEGQDLLKDANRKLMENKLDILQRRLEAEPDNSEFREQVGDLLCFFENYTEAVKHYQRAAQLSPQADLPKAKLAFCLAQRGMLDLAEETLAEVKLSITESPDQEELKRFFYDIAVKFEKELESQKALNFYKKIFRVDASYRNVVAKIEKIENLGVTISPYGKRIRSKPGQNT
jgi:tetratricopeptide (TPR) repeat protein